MTTENPYSPPAALPYELPAQQIHLGERAGAGRRLSNYLLDRFVVFVLMTGISVVFRGQDWAIFLIVPVVFLYYAISEAVWGRTLGKLVTGTRVITAEGMKPTFGRSSIRTLCRIIPFEAFSFLGAEARGWHDSISKTWVIRS